MSLLQKDLNPALSLYCNSPTEKEKTSLPGLYMKMQSPRFQGQKGRSKVSGRSMRHTLPGMLGTSQKGVPRCQTSSPELPIKYEIHERIPDPLLSDKLLLLAATLW